MSNTNINHKERISVKLNKHKKKNCILSEYKKLKIIFNKLNKILLIALLNIILNHYFVKFSRTKTIYTFDSGNTE